MFVALWSFVYFVSKLFQSRRFRRLVVFWLRAVGRALCAWQHAKCLERINTLEATYAHHERHERYAALRSGSPLRFVASPRPADEARVSSFSRP